MIRRWTKCRASPPCRPPYRRCCSFYVRCLEKPAEVIFFTAGAKMNVCAAVGSDGEVSYHRRFTIWSGGEATIVCIESRPFVWTKALIRPAGRCHLLHGRPIVPLSLFVCTPRVVPPPDPKARYAFALQWWIFVKLFSSLSLVWMLSDSSQSTCVEVDCYKI